jgi:E3 ubiquitin-protein ligase UBR1/E3 ubiquitin-protein ligase UBR3
MTCGLDCLQVDTPSKTVSLHIPLHRTLGAILQKLILFPWDGFEYGFFSVLDFDYTKEEVCF